MIEPESSRDESIETLVRRHLERTAEGIDPRPGFARLQAALWEQDGGESGPHRGGESASRDPGGRWPGRARRWVWTALAVASLLLLAAVGLFESRPVHARPESLVLDAKKAHLQPLDRCYLVEVRKDSTLYDEYLPLASRTQQARLWTRGDRFWVETTRADRRWAWGRDQRNSTWIAIGPRRGLRLEADEVPRWFHLYCSLYTVRLERLLGDLIRDFTLTLQDAGPSSAVPSTQIVQAMPKPGRKVPGLRSVRLEIDPETRVVRRMVLEQTLWGKPFATASYTLVDTQRLVDKQYTLEGHLGPEADVFSKDHLSERRRVVLARWLGPNVAARFPLKNTGEK
jgi:hypothetical protein